MKKRALSLFLAFVMALGLCVPALAEGEFEAEEPIAPVEEPETLEEPAAEDVPEEAAAPEYTNDPVEPLAASEPEDEIYSVTADTGQVFLFAISEPVEDIKQIVHKIVSSDDGYGGILYRIYLDGAFYTGSSVDFERGLSGKYEYNLIEGTTEKRLELVCSVTWTKNAPINIRLLKGEMPVVSESIYYVDNDGKPIDDVSPYLKEKLEYYLPGRWVVFYPQNAGVVLEISGGGEKVKLCSSTGYGFSAPEGMLEMTVKITTLDSIPLVFKRNGTDYDESEGLLREVRKVVYPDEVFEVPIKRGYALEVVSGAEPYGSYDPGGAPYALFNYPDGPYAHFQFKVVENANEVEIRVTEAEPLYTVQFDENKISACRFGYVNMATDSMYEIRSGSGIYEYDVNRATIYFSLKDESLAVSDSDLYEVNGPHNNYALIINEEAAIKAGTVEIKTEPAKAVTLSFAGDTNQFSFYTLEGDEKRELKDGDSVLIDRMIYYVPLTEEARQRQYEVALYGGEIIRWGSTNVDPGFVVASAESNRAVLEVFQRHPITFHISSEDEQYPDNQIAMLYNYGVVRDGSVAMLGRGDRIFADEYEGTHLYVKGLQMEYVEQWSSWKRYTLRIPDGVDEVTIALLKEPSPTPIEKWRSPYDTSGSTGGGGSYIPDPTPAPTPSESPGPSPEPGVTPEPSPVPVPVDPPKTNGGTGWSYDYDTGDYYYFVEGMPKANYWANEAAASMWGYWYYVGADGKLATGLQYIENSNGTGWYFLQPDNTNGCIGRMLTGWQWIGPEAGTGWFNTAHGGVNGQCTYTTEWGSYNAATGLWGDGLSHKG